MVVTTTVRQNRWPWLMLPVRLVLFAFWQIVIALLFVFQGTSPAWKEAAAWWPVTAVLANLVCIWLLVALYRQEGARFWDVFRLQRQTLKQDVLILLGALLLAGPIAFLPNTLTATWLFGDQEVALALFLQPLPAWAIVLTAVLFPITIALSELPTYFAYCMPRLETQLGQRWLPVLLASFFLALQHTTLPLLFDGRFLIWRLLMFIPFALFIGLLLRWRPQMLPYLVVVHGLLDMATVLMIPMAV